MRIIKVLTLFISVILQNSCYAQNSLTNKMIKEDLNFLSKNLIEISIHPFARFSEKKYYEKIDSIQLTLKDVDVISPKDLYALLQPIVSRLQDGHTEISHENLFINNDYYIFPYSIDCNTEGIITKDLKSNYLKSNTNVSGENIIKIDNLNQKELINLFDLYNSGESKILRIKYGEFYFNQLFNLLINKGKEYVIIEFGNGDKQKIKLVKASDWIQSINQSSKESDFYSYNISNNQAILNLKSFNNLEKFKKLLNNMFNEIAEKNIQNLIIDLRGNGGGNSALGDELLKHLLNRPFTQYEKTLIKYSKPSKKYFSELTDIDSIYLKEYLLKTDGVIDTIYKKDKLITPYEFKNKFKGKVYLLINSTTYSSAADFAQAFKYYSLGKIVGNVTGGEIISKGEAIKIQLPNSKLYAYISSSIDYNIGASYNDYEGVKPDYEVGNDDAMKFIELLN